VRELPQHLQYNVINTVTFFAASQPTAAVVSLYTDENNAIFEDQTATIESVDTTLNGAVSAGATSIIVAANTNIDAGDRLIIADPVEEVLVAATPASTTVTLRRPLLHDHATGEKVQSTRLTFSVSAANSATKFWDGRLKWTLDTNTIRYQDCICTEYAFYRAATEQHLFDEEAKLQTLLDPEDDVSRLLDDGLAEVVARVNALTQGRAWSYTGPTQFAAATVFAALMAFYRSRPGTVAGEMMARYEDTLQKELTLITGASPRDTDQDGVIEREEQVMRRSGMIRRG
jgi:hypothetical protein